MSANLEIHPQIGEVVKTSKVGEDPPRLGVGTRQNPSFEPNRVQL